MSATEVLGNYVNSKLFLLYTALPPKKPLLPPVAQNMSSPVSEEAVEEQDCTGDSGMGTGSGSGQYGSLEEWKDAMQHPPPEKPEHSYQPLRREITADAEGDLLAKMLHRAVFYLSLIILHMQRHFTKTWTIHLSCMHSIFSCSLKFPPFSREPPRMRDDRISGHTPSTIKNCF